LKGKARSILDGIHEVENLEFEKLKSRLELRFEVHLTQVYYTQFTNRKQKLSEDLTTLSADLERLSRLAYPECTDIIRDKIACAQFIAALSDGFIKRTLQLENVTSLKSAIERAMAIKVVQKNSFKGYEFYKKNKGTEEDSKSSTNFQKNKSLNKFQKNKIAQNKECWQCGARGHFRSKYLALSKGENKN
jgi:hypothetical protein